MTDATDKRGQCMEAIRAERERQCKRWGADQFRLIGPWQTLAVLTEELGEIARVLNDSGGLAYGLDPADTTPASAQRCVRTEIVQLAACCLACLEALP